MTVTYDDREIVSLDVVVRERDGRVVRYSFSDLVEGQLDAPDPKYGGNLIDGDRRLRLKVTGLENAHRYRCDAKFFVMTAMQESP